jgi:hypothetical protein
MRSSAQSSSTEESAELSEKESFKRFVQLAIMNKPEIEDNSGFEDRKDDGIREIQDEDIPTGEGSDDEDLGVEHPHQIIPTVPLMTDIKAKAYYLSCLEGTSFRCLLRNT